MAVTRLSVKNERGVAILAVMVVLIIMTALGMAALTITNMETLSASYSRTNEAGVQAAESCVQTGINVIQQALAAGSVPATLVWPNGPVVNAADLEPEVLLTRLSDPDVAMGAAAAPDLRMNVPVVNAAYSVVGDIDKDFVKISGGGEFGGADYATFYRVSCFAQNIMTGSVSNVQAEYYCFTAKGDQQCKRRL